MSKLYATVQAIDALIARRKLPGFKTKGKIAIEVGFPLSLIGPATPDDPRKVERLKVAVREILGEQLEVDP